MRANECSAGAGSDLDLPARETEDGGEHLAAYDAVDHAVAEHDDDVEEDADAGGPPAH